MDNLDIIRLKEKLLHYNNIETLSFSDRRDIEEVGNIVVNLLQNKNFKNLNIVILPSYHDSDFQNLMYESVISSTSIESFHIQSTDNLNITKAQLKSLFKHQFLKSLTLDLISSNELEEKRVSPSMIKNTSLLRFSFNETATETYRMLDGLVHNKSLVVFEINVDSTDEEINEDDIEDKLINVLNVNKNLLFVGEPSFTPKIKELLSNNLDNATKLTRIVEDKTKYLTQGSYLKIQKYRTLIEFLLHNNCQERSDTIFGRFLQSAYNPHNMQIEEYMYKHIYNISEEAITKVNKKLKEAENNAFLTLGVCKKLNPESTLVAIFFPHIMEKIFSYSVIKDNVTQYVVNMDKVIKKYQDACMSGNLEKVDSAFKMMRHETFRDSFDNPISRMISAHKAEFFLNRAEKELLLN